MNFRWQQQVGVTCLVYYLPPSKHANSNSYLRHNYKLVAGGNDELNCSVHRQHNQHHYYQNHRYHDDENCQIDEMCSHHPAEIDSNGEMYHHYQPQHKQQHHSNHHHPQCTGSHSELKSHEFSANRKLISNNCNERNVDLSVKFNEIDEKPNSKLLSPSTHEHLPPLSDNKIRKYKQPACANVKSTSLESSPLTLTLTSPATVAPIKTNVVPPSFCYIKAKYREIKNSTGPIENV